MTYGDQEHPHAACRERIAELEEEVAALSSRGGIHWWHKIREVANILGCKSLAEIPATLERQRDAAAENVSRWMEAAETEHGRVLELEAEVERLRAENKTLARIGKGEVWYWQGDGYDFPESLACPVIMEPDVLRKVLKAAEKAGGETC